MHKNNFDALRLLAALSVVISHQFLFVTNAQPLTVGTITLGSFAVLVFFSISGYLVASSWIEDPTLWRFAARRILRIWPAYVVVVVATAVSFGIFDPRPLASVAATMYVVKHLTLHSFEWAFFPLHNDSRLNAPLWTIPYELACYAVLGCVAVIFRKVWAVAAVLLCVALVASLAGRQAVDPSNASIDLAARVFGALFAMGALLRIFPRLQAPMVTVALLALGIVAWAAGWQLVALAVAVPVVCILIGVRSWPVVRETGRFGDFSYGIYLWGWPVQQMVVDYPPLQGRLMLSFAATLPLVLAIAAVSWHGVEKRALRAKPSRTTAWPKSLRLQLG